MNINIRVDLRQQFGSIRDQHQRPTCMAFAASDAHAYARGSLDALSVEYAFYRAVQRQAVPDRTRGVSYQIMTETIAADGQPLEDGWPYIAHLQPADAWTPPAALGDIFTHDTETIGADIEEIVKALESGSPVLVGMQISGGFFTLAVDSVLPGLPTDPAVGNHAVVVVGYGDLNGERCLLIRNSWGESWADQGYGWIHEEYLAPRLLVAGVMQ
jgi:hypothetical protein